MPESNTAVATIQFEDDYFFRSNRSVTTAPDIALTEFVANAWDAGSFNVKITIPFDEGDEIIVEDDGVGMTEDEFAQRWMTLNYNRQKRQGKEVEFPLGVEAYKRIAYGRNGVGRHGMFCFSDMYTIETWRDGICNQYNLVMASGAEPFSITHHTSLEKEGHGTKIRAFVHRHLPNVDSMTEIVSARFLYDPKFFVEINEKCVDLLNHNDIHEQKELQLGNVHLRMTIIDSTKTAMKSQQHGIAFWVSGRLVGKPSWSWDGFQFLDGRFRAAKRYTIIIQTDDLIDDVLPDWTGFVDSANMTGFFTQLKAPIDEFIASVMADQIGELQQDVIRETRDQLETLSAYSQRGVSNFIENVTQNNPVVSPDFLRTAVEAVISIEKSKKGEQLLNQLSQMAPEDLEKLSVLLETWNVDDILAVLNEIDKRILVIEAIGRIYEDKNTDELHTLHPLVLNARWLFGAEFDSPMFVSNNALNTVLKKLFKDEDYDPTVITNPRKRPDIVCLKTSTLKAVCTDRVDSTAGEIMKPDQVLVIEIKRGGFKIEVGEVNQAENYVRQIRKSGALHDTATIHAFVVGASIGDVDKHKVSDSGVVDVVTFGHLVETAKIKLFRLQEQLSEHYDSLGDKSIVEKALQEAKQTKLELK